MKGECIVSRNLKNVEAWCVANAQWGLLGLEKAKQPERSSTFILENHPLLDGCRKKR